MPLNEISDDGLVYRAMLNARPNGTVAKPRWVAVMDHFGLGSNYARQLCEQHNMNPDGMVDGAHCGACVDREDEEEENDD